MGSRCLTITLTTPPYQKSPGSFDRKDMMRTIAAVVFTLMGIGVFGQQTNKQQGFQREVQNPLNCPENEQSQDGDTIIVNYQGFLGDGTKFDSSLAKGREPISFVLGEGKVIRGWEEGLRKTCPGEDVVMIIPPEWGYGRLGAGGVIPGNATLYFTSTLEGIVRETDTSPKASLDSDGKCKKIKTVTKGDKVTLITTISLLSNTTHAGKEVDESADTIDQFPGNLIKGWKLGVQGACEGEKKKILLGPKLAWGERGVPGVISPNASVVIDVTVESVKRDLVFNFLNQISSGGFNNGK